jgi:hypothetical protein
MFGKKQNSAPAAAPVTIDNTSPHEAVATLEAERKASRSGSDPSGA